MERLRMGAWVLSARIGAIIQAHLPFGGIQQVKATLNLAQQAKIATIKHFTTMNEDTFR